MRRRAQAALEFLMTYGWAILIMLVVIAVLFYLGVFNSSTSVPSSCALPAGFTCAEFSLDSSGRLFLDLGQATGKTITVTGVGCGPVGGSVTNLSIPVTVQTGGHSVVSDSDITCSGNYSGAFKGKVSIRYQPAGAAYNKTVTGDLSAPVASVSAGEQDQWNASYGYYRQVTINTGVPSNLTNFPAYFVFDTQHLIAWGRMNSTCKDLRVINSTKNGVLDYEIENNTCNTTSTVVWFRVPQTNAANDYTAYAFYGNNSASDAQNKPGVWQNGFVRVWHLGDLSESRAGATATNANATYAPSGKFGGAYAFGGVNSYLNTSGNINSYLAANASFSISSWVNPLLSENNKVFLGRSGAPRLYFRLNSNPLFGLGNNYSNLAGLVFSAAAWQHVVFEYDAQSSRYLAYKNGALASNVTYSGDGVTPADNFCIGGDGVSEYANASLDEVRISSVARSQDWVTAEYGQTYSVGSEVVN